MDRYENYRSFSILSRVNNEIHRNSILLNAGITQTYILELQFGLPPFGASTNVDMSDNCCLQKNRIYLPPVC